MDITFPFCNMLPASGGGTTYRQIGSRICFMYKCITFNEKRVFYFSSKTFLKKTEKGKRFLQLSLWSRGLFHPLFVSSCTCMVQKGHPLSSLIFPVQKLSFLECKSVYSYSEQTMFPDDFLGNEVQEESSERTQYIILLVVCKYFLAWVWVFFLFNCQPLVRRITLLLCGCRQ